MLFQALVGHLLAKVQSLAGPSLEVSFGAGLSLASSYKNWELCSHKAAKNLLIIGAFGLCIDFELVICCI